MLDYKVTIQYIDKSVYIKNNQVDRFYSIAKLILKGGDISKHKFTTYLTKNIEFL